MTPEQMLAGLQEEVKGLAETVRDPPQKTRRSRLSRQLELSRHDDGERSCAAEQANSLQWS